MKAMMRLIVGMSGASGAIYGIRALEVLRGVKDVETHLVLSPSAKRTIVEETSWTAARVEALADVVHPHRDIGAAIASGSFRTAGMLIAPCSVKTLSGIAASYADNLLTRAADVCLKERRPLVLCFREAPLSLVHLRNLTAVTEAGATVIPAAPGFYHQPKTVQELVDFVVQRIVDHMGLDISLAPRWKG